MALNKNDEERHFIEQFRRNTLISSEPKTLSVTLKELARLLRQDYASEEDLMKDIELLNSCYGIYNKRNEKTTLFHDAIEFEYVDTLKDMSELQSPGMKLMQHILSTVCNNRGDTLLHHVCRLRVSEGVIHEVYELVSPWILIRQNASQQTPVHVALLETPDSSTFIAFMDILLKRTPDDVLIKLLRRHDLSGRTPLHLAVLENHYEFVDFMLSFCRAKDLDASQIVTLGSGETLLHLAVSNGLDEMEQLILMHMPNAAMQVNYAGYDAYGKCMFDDYDEDEEEDAEEEKDDGMNVKVEDEENEERKQMVVKENED